MTIDSFLAKYDENVADCARLLCEKITCLVPKAQQKVYPGWKIIGFSFDGGMKTSFTAVAPHKNHVNLSFLQGASLPDSASLLEGSGKGGRHIKICTLKEARAAKLNRYIQAAAKLASAPPPDEKKIAGMGDAAMKKATGEDWAHWLAFLDKAGAKTKDHKAIVAILRKKAPKLSQWWRQQITVGYEQARGLRLIHEKPGGFEISKSKTVNASAAKLYAAFRDARQRRLWLAEKGLKTRVAHENKSIRLDWSDGKTIVEARFYPKSRTKCSVTVQHMKLGSAKEAEQMKLFWGERLALLKERLES